MKIKRGLFFHLVREALSQQEIDSLVLANAGSDRKKVYRSLLKKHHPDRGGELENAQQLTILFRALEDDLHKSMPQKEPKSREEQFVDYFSSFKSATSEIFNSTNDRELLKSYGNILLDYYTKKGQQRDAYLIYDDAVKIVYKANFEFDKQLISDLGFTVEYVRWKFKSMMHAKEASNSKVMKNIFYHVQKSVVEMEKVINPGKGTSRQQWFISEIHKSLTKGDKKRCRLLLDAVASENKLAFSQYDLYNTVLSLIY